MKELSIEEKAKAYDNIIEKANKMHNENCEACQICIEELIPELKESEDERIREILVKYFTSNITNPDYEICGIPFKEVLAWFEKQGKKDEEILILKDQIESLQAARKAQEIVHKIELEKQGEKGTNGNEREIPNSAWSEEDNAMLISIENILIGRGHSFHDKEINWLKSLRPQSRWKPSAFHLECIEDAIAIYDERGINAIGLKEILEELKKLNG